jgi:hypothetical protein
MLTATSGARVALLRHVREQLEPGAPVLISFYLRGAEERNYRLACTVANLVRLPRSRPRIELGDMLAPNFVHCFTLDEARDELNAAGFDVAFSSSDGYGHAVGIVPTAMTLAQAMERAS